MPNVVHHPPFGPAHHLLWYTVEMASDRFDLQGERALITGAGSGLGRAIADAMAEHGVRVAILDRDPSAAADACAAIEEAGGTALELVADVAGEGAAEESVGRVVEAWGGLDILVNNAGIGELGPAQHISPDRFRRIYEVDVFGPFAFSQAAFRPMSAQRRGCIINMASIAGLQALYPDQDAAYHSAKAALIMLTRALAVEWAEHGIRVNAIAPGFMLTPPVIQQQAEPEVWDYHMAGIPMGRPGRPEDVQGAAVYLASPAAAYVTGTLMVVDGGYTSM